MDIRLVIKKAFFYSTGIALVSGIIVVISFLSSWFAERIPGFNFWTVPLIAGIMAFVIGRIFWNKSKEIEKAYEIERKAHQELKHLDEVKDQFILATQHHLRTPLTIMRGYLSAILEDDKTLKEETKDYLIKTSNSTDRLTNLVNELLDISQFQVGRNPLEIEATNIKRVIKEITKELKPEIKKKNLDVKIIPDEKWPDIPVDRKKIKIVLANLIDNAIKYTKKGSIIITGKKLDKHFRISVKDVGIGINPKDIKTIFSKYFERGEEAKRVFTTGRGIGLFIAASIIKAHNGIIYAKSEGIDKGSEFVVELPLN